LNPKLIRILAVVAVVVFGLIYVMINSAVEKKQVYQGQVTDKISKAKFGKWFSVNSTGKDHKYYLVIQEDGGKTFKVRVPRSVYSRFKKGDSVVKSEGDRYPVNESSPYESISMEQVKSLL